MVPVLKLLYDSALNRWHLARTGTQDLHLWVLCCGGLYLLAQCHEMRCVQQLSLSTMTEKRNYTQVDHSDEEDSSCLLNTANVIGLVLY
jgi:hypothetical protein